MTAKAKPVYIPIALKSYARWRRDRPVASQIDPNKPADGIPVLKSDLRANLAAAKSEIETLQTGKAALGHTHEVGDLAVSGTPNGHTFLRGDGVWGRPAVEEIAVTGSRTLGSADLGRLLTYTGSGDTWILTAPGVAGEVAIENDGSGAITLDVSGVTLLNAVTEIGAGKSASLRFFSGGTKVKVFIET